MTTGALITFVVFCILIGCFGLFIAYHKEDSKNNKNHKHV